METAGQVEPSNEDIATVRAFIERVEWVFARTMAKQPALVRGTAVPARATGCGVEALVQLIRQHGFKRRWRSRACGLATLDGFSYWAIWPMVNRTTLVVDGMSADAPPPCRPA